MYYVFNHVLCDIYLVGVSTRPQYGSPLSLLSIACM